MEHKIIKSQRGDVHYWIDKSDTNKKCIVFTHGVTGNHTMFEKQIEYFTDKYTLVLWDVPLHGLSRPYADFSYKNTAEELYKIVEFENLSNIVLVGMSMGGYPSQEYAYRYPDKVSGFIALDTTPFGTDYYSKSDIFWLKQVEPMAKLFPQKALKNSMAKSVSKSDYGCKIMKQMLEPLSKNEIAQQMGIAYAGFIKENKDVNFDFPVLILLGEHDATGKVAQYCKAWAEKENYPLHIIKDAAHFSNADNYEAVNREIEEFIKCLNE